MKQGIRILTAVLSVICAVIWCMASWFSSRLPDKYWINDTGVIQLSDWVTAVQTESVGKYASANSTDSNTCQLSLRLFHLIPLKNATATVVDTPVVMLGGMPFGIKMYTKGVLVVRLSDVETAAGLVNPAERAGICVGDVILAVDGVEVNAMTDVSKAIETCGGKTLAMKILRDGITFTARFQPAFSVNDQCYKAGMWIRDSSAGIGTMTFYDPQTGMFAGLGHGVSDVDTGELLPISAGEVVSARIFDVVKGESGTPGELCGSFTGTTLGELYQNGNCGVYGALKHTGAMTKAVPMALAQEVKEGPARLYTTVDGDKPAWYDVEITQVRLGQNSSRHMIIHITDEDLLEKTGGIVQGMSGSPLVQDGKLVGAVTHVFINDPTKGYAIFAETMLETAQNVAKEQKLKDAS